MAWAEAEGINIDDAFSEKNESSEEEEVKGFWG